MKIHFFSMDFTSLFRLLVLNTKKLIQVFSHIFEKPHLAKFPNLFCFHFQSSYGYGDLFSDTWKAFTDYDVIHLKTYDSKRVLETLLKCL